MNKNKWIRTGIIIAIVILSILISSAVLKHVTIHQVYSYYVNSIHHLTGLNKYLIKAAVLLLIIPFILGLKWYFFSPFNKKRRYKGAAILIAIMILYNLSLYYFTRSSYFAFSEGKVLKWYAETPEGVKFFDAPGFDPKYGTKLKQATPEIIANLERKNRGMQPKPVAYHSIKEIEFFDSITRAPKVWYYLNPSGVYELFDNPGVHPTYGEPLIPITQQVVLQIKSKYDEDIQRRQEEARKLEEQKAAEERVAFFRKQEESRQLEEQREALEREAFLNRYLITSLLNNPETQDVVVLVIDEDNKINHDVSQKITSLLKDKGLNLTTSLFTESFVIDGLFEKIFVGDANEVKNLELSKHSDRLILGKKKTDFTENPDLQNMITAKASVEIHVTSSETGTIEDSFTIEETGAGFSKSIAEGAAMERILAIISQKLSETFKKGGIGQ